MATAKSQVTTIDDEPEVAAPTAAKVISGSAYDPQLSGKKQTLTIHASEAEGGQEAVNVAVNGYAFQIPRGTPCEVPVEVVQILKNAVTTVFQQLPGGGIASREVPRFAFSVQG